MRIALVSPLFESVPPKLYGGTERVVHYLSSALAGLGHHVTLFASGDSQPGEGVELVPICPRALRLDPAGTDGVTQHILQLERVLASRHHFDIAHFHIDVLQYPLIRHLGIPAVTTLHGRLDLPGHKRVLMEYLEAELVSISHSQRGPLADRPWRATVHHGLPRDLLPFGKGDGGYLAFLGRISPEKRVDRAVEIARLAGKRLRVAAKVDEADRGHYATVLPLLQEPHVDFIGEISESQKGDFLGKAEALLFPIDWPEPFGLVMIESLATGTPVVAFAGGAVGEIIEPGRGGFVVGSIAEAVRAVQRLTEIRRAECRQEFERRFLSERMARDYVRVFEEVLGGRGKPCAESAA